MAGTYARYSKPEGRENRRRILSALHSYHGNGATAGELAETVGLNARTVRRQLAAATESGDVIALPAKNIDRRDVLSFVHRLSKVYVLPEFYTPPNVTVPDQRKGNQ